MNNQILILYEIGRRMKSKNDRIFISSSEFGISLGISQQTASRYLQNLEKRNLISRKISNEGQEIRLTSEGFDLVYEIYANLREFFEGKKDIPVFEGNVISGLGEGAYYIKEYEDRIKEILGFKPFPGTLNINKGTSCPYLERYAKGIIKGFKRGGRTFGEVKFLPVRIISKDKSANCYLILPKRRHYKDSVEIISELNLKKYLRIKNDDRVGIELIV